MSSRNAYLTREQRSRAPALADALRHVAGMLKGGASGTDAAAEGRRILEAVGFEPVDYLEVREEDGLRLVEGPVDPSRPARVFGAATLGETRLIDNLPV